jgi:AraC-like DNA-binding protein
MKRKDVLLIQKIREYLDENLYEEHSIQEICRLFNINREKLQSGFHELVQTTVHAYIIQQRISQAAIRLLETDDSIKAIALDSGYKKQRSFNKTFKAIYNITPASYRRLHQQRVDSKQ